MIVSIFFVAFIGIFFQSTYNGTGRFVAFLITTTGGRNALYLDDLVVSPCPLPDLTVSGARQVKAALPEGTPVDYWMEYGPEGCIQGDSTNTLVHVTENPYYITGLQPNTTYNFFARCFEQVPTCAPPTTLTTSEEMSIPYCETCDGESGKNILIGRKRVRPKRMDKAIGQTRPQK